MTNYHNVALRFGLIVILSHLARGESMAKPGCPSHCGNVSVPYPFGVGSGCFLDKWFKMVCRENGTVLSLNSTGPNLVVTEILLDGTIRATRSDFIENNTEQSQEFEGSPLQLPALVAAPMVIKWQLLNYSAFDVFGTDLPANRSDFRDEPLLVNSSCKLYNITSTRLECSCPRGYQGNPYLLNGCQDIDECDQSQNGAARCVSSTDCVNFGGGFRCNSDSDDPVQEIFQDNSFGVGVLVLVLGPWVVYKLVKRRKKIQQKQRFFKRNGGILMQQQLTNSDQVDVETKLFDSEELEKATDHFNVNRILGQGGQGTVYKGMLVDGRIVAVKKSKLLDEKKITEFINEVVILSQINHRNVVRLLGCCLETEVPLLVYEFIPNGTLSHYIVHDQSETFSFTWDARLRVATEIAGALAYLHSSATIPIYHRDIKSTNILLDNKFRAKLADFGTSRTISIDQTHLTTLVRGTFGYLDPEYFRTSKFTDKSDVYSFGVVLVELLSGQKPLSMTGPNEEIRSLSTYFSARMEENRLFDVVDPRILEDGVKEDNIVAFANLAQNCLNLIGKDRPTMKEVETELERIQNSIQPPRIGKQGLEMTEYVSNEVFEQDLSDTFPSSNTWPSNSPHEAALSSGQSLLAGEKM